MTTNTTTSTDAPFWWVDDQHSGGFAYDPDLALGDAVANLLVAERDGFDNSVKAARAMAAADAASPLSRPKRADMAGSVWIEAHGRAWSMSPSTYSKRVRAGGATPEQVLAFLAVCDTPSLDKLYEWMPKATNKGGRPKGAKSAPKPTAEPAVAEPEVSVPETVRPTRWDDAHVSTAARAAVAALVEQGADEVTRRLVAAEMLRLLSPVRSAA